MCVSVSVCVSVVCLCPFVYAFVMSECGQWVSERMYCGWCLSV